MAPKRQTDGSGRHSSNPHFCRCGVGYYTDTDDTVSGCPFRVLSNPSIERSFWQLGWSVIAEVWLLAFMLCVLGEGYPTSDQSDKDAEEGRVELSDLRGNCMADVAANNGTREHVPFEPSDEWKHWGTVCVFVLNNGPGTGLWSLNLRSIW
eukprot:984709-Amphidinium_carterae.5